MLTHAIAFNVQKGPMMLTITEPRTYTVDLDLRVCKKLCSCGLGDPVLGDQFDILLSLSLTNRTVHFFVCQWHPVCSFVPLWHVDLPTSSLTAIFQLGRVRRPPNAGKDKRSFSSQNFKTGSEDHPASDSEGTAVNFWWQSSWSVMLTTHLF